MDNKPKKRGRKPKNSTKSKDYNQIQTDQNDNLIINLKDLSEETSFVGETSSVVNAGVLSSYLFPPSDTVEVSL